MKRFLTWLLLKLYGKYTISAKDFLREVEKIAKKKGQGYYQCRVTFVKYDSREEPVVTLTGYIHGTNHEDGTTIKEVCDKLENSTNEDLNVVENIVF
jgi:hypothetical protein